jgi:hypothetical protein
MGCFLENDHDMSCLGFSYRLEKRQFLFTTEFFLFFFAGRLYVPGFFFSVMIVGCIAREFEHIASFSDFAYCVFGG